MTTGTPKLYVANTKDAFDRQFWPALQAAFAQGLTEEQVDLAMDAARKESAKWVGSLSWGEPLAHIVGAAFRAIAMKERL